jgi:hypothetical protein
MGEREAIRTDELHPRLVEVISRVVGAALSRGEVSALAMAIADDLSEQAMRNDRRRIRGIVNGYFGRLVGPGSQTAEDALRQIAVIVADGGEGDG